MLGLCQAIWHGCLRERIIPCVMTMPRLEIFSNQTFYIPHTVAADLNTSKSLAASGKCFDTLLSLPLYLSL